MAAGAVAVEDVRVGDGVEETANGAAEFADVIARIRLGVIVEEQLAVFVHKSRGE